MSKIEYVGVSGSASMGFGESAMLKLVNIPHTLEYIYVIGLLVILE